MNLIKEIRKTELFNCKWTNGNHDDFKEKQKNETFIGSFCRRVKLCKLAF